MLLLLVIFAPVLAVLGIVAGLPARLTSLVAAFCSLLGALLIYLGMGHGDQFHHVVSLTLNEEWGLRFAFGVDGLSMIMVLLTTIVTVAALWFAAETVQRPRSYYSCLLLIAAGALGSFTALDLFFFYAFHELALIPTFLLIGIWGSGNRYVAAWKITIYLALGSFVLLLGLIMLYQSVPEIARTFDIRTLQAAAADGAIPAESQRTIYLLLLLGFGILISLFPFHTWAPEAYASAPPPAAMLHAGVLKKFGLYGLLRLALPMLPEGARYWSDLLLVLLLGNIIYVGLVTIAQKRLDWMLGYSSVMHMGYVFLGIASANLLGTNGAALLIFAHGISIALLFAIAGELRTRLGTLELKEMGGLARKMPVASLLFGFAAFASIGLPGFANFSAEVMIFFGAFARDLTPGEFGFFQWATVLALWGVVISAVYMLRSYRAAFWGPPNARWDSVGDISRSLRWAGMLLIIATVWAGFYPQSMVRLVSPTFRSQLTAGR